MPAQSGASVKMLVDGQEVGWATGFNASTDYEVFLVDALGNVDVEEVEIVGRKHRATAALVGIKGRSLKSMLLEPKNGTDAATSTANALNFAPKTIELRDIVTDATVETLEGVKLTSSGMSVQKGGVLLRDVSFVVVRRSDHNDQ